jgi:CBS domain-containing protein
MRLGRNDRREAEMAETVREVMTSDPTTLDASSTIAEAGRAMRDGDFGAVIVTEDDSVRGIVTDRDIVVRAVAGGRDPESTRLEEVVSEELETLSPDDSIDDAVAKVRAADVRRLPVVEGGRAVGIVSLGDLAIERDRDSALADISAATPNN